MRRIRRRGINEDIKDTQKLRRFKPLPANRPQALTPPLRDTPHRSNLSWSARLIDLFKRRSVKQLPLSNQMQSLLFQRLPYEVRRIIWSHVLTGRVLHIVRAPPGLLAIDCAEDVEPEFDTRGHHCWGIKDGGYSVRKTPLYYEGSLHNHPARAARWLPLLQTCQRIYGETISMVYAHNLFDFDHLETFCYLVLSVLPKRLDEVRLLNLTWDFRYYKCSSIFPIDLITWSNTCQVLASFAGLQELTLHLTGSDLAPGRDAKSRWGPILEQLRPIKAPKRFDVFLHWPEEICKEICQQEAYPFRLLHRNEKPPLRDSIAGRAI